MPFEVGLAVARSRDQRSSHEWFLFESKAHRLSKSLSDLNGTDPYIHNGQPEDVLRELTNALVRRRNSPSLEQLKEIYKRVRIAASKLKQNRDGASVFEARSFQELVALATDICAAYRRGDYSAL
jgi:hypothetical protein